MLSRTSNHFQAVSDQIDQQFGTLTPSQKKVAVWMRDHLQLVAMYPAREVGVETGVSEATIHRLAVALGYKNYVELKEALQAELLNERTLIRVDHIQQQKRRASGFQEAIDLEFENIAKTFDEVTEERIHKVTDLFIQAKTIYIAGWRASLAVTAPLSYQLHLILGNAHPLKIGELAEKLAYFTPEDVLFTVGFPRYDKQAVQLVKEAKEMGTKVVVMTDSPLSPFCEWADVSIFASTESTSFLDSYVAPVMMGQLLVQNVALKAPERVKQNLKIQEKFFKSWGLIFQ